MAVSISAGVTAPTEDQHLHLFLDIDQLKKRLKKIAAYRWDPIRRKRKGRLADFTGEGEGCGDQLSEGNLII